MTTRRALAGAGASLLLGSSLVVAGAASPALAMCPDDTGYALSATSTSIPFRNVPVFKDGKGGTLTVSRSYSGTATYQVTAGAESEVGAVLAKAKVSISASLSKSNTTDTTHTYSHKIDANKYGHARYVSWGKTVRWKKWRTVTTTSGCQNQVFASGTIKFPALAEGWKFWQTLT